MKLIIDIPQKVYDKVLSGDGTGAVWAGYVKDGKPLPKGHGDLKDHNDIIKSLFDFTSGNKTLGQCIDDAPTIIEADKEG